MQKTLAKVVLPTVASQGNIPWLTVDSNGNPVLSSSVNLKLDNQGTLSTHSGDINFGRNISMNFNRIKDLGMPIALQDATSKVYVDGHFVKVNGLSNMQGNLNMNNYNIVNAKDPVNGSDRVTKSYLSSNTVSTTRYESNLTLPGFPVTQDIKMCFIPSFASCNIAGNGEVIHMQETFSSLN